MKANKLFYVICAVTLAVTITCKLNAQNLRNNPALDEKVKKFLEDHSGQWHDLNISETDGQVLHDNK